MSNAENRLALIVDDDWSTTETIYQLAFRGLFTTTGVSHPQEVPQALGKERYDQVIVDGLQGGFLEVIPMLLAEGYTLEQILILTSDPEYIRIATANHWPTMLRTANFGIELRQRFKN